jgi:hypothetical protein
MTKAKQTTLLIWQGGNAYPGWPACDHEESDPELHQAKLASGLYRTPDAQEQGLVDKERRARKAQANAKAAREAQEAAERAQAAAQQAEKEAADRQAAADARLAAARATLKEAEDGES